MVDFDEQDALERTAGDRDLLSEVIRFTLEDVPVLLEKIQLLLNEGNWSDASRLAHKLKGSAGACGAGRLYLTALELELACRDGDEACALRFPPIQDAFDAFLAHPDVRTLASLDAGTQASVG